MNAKFLIDMKSMFPLLLLLLGSTVLAYGQEAFVIKQYGFSMKTPKDWIATDKAELSDNLKKFDLTDEALKKLLKENNGSIVLAAFYKYAVTAKVGLIPTIQVRARSKGPVEYQEFKRAIVKSMETSKQILDEYEFAEEPSEIEISGVKSVLIVGKFKMKGKKGQILNVRSRMYAIPLKNYFFQVNFTDGFAGDDCSDEFDELVKTIKIGRGK